MTMSRLIAIEGGVAISDEIMAAINAFARELGQFGPNEPAFGGRDI